MDENIELETKKLDLETKKLDKKIIEQEVVRRNLEICNSLLKTCLSGNWKSNQTLLLKDTVTNKIISHLEKLNA